MRAAGTAKWKPILVAAMASMAVAVAGGLATDTGPWYEALSKPAWRPPARVFAPVWTVIFALTAVAGVMAWRYARTAQRRRIVIAAFLLNGILNFAWSFLFFRMQRPDWAFAEVVLLWLSIVLLLVVVFREARNAALLLLPYLAWVSVAAMLNLSIVRLNAPFAPVS